MADISAKNSCLVAFFLGCAIHRRKRKLPNGHPLELCASGCLLPSVESELLWVSCRIPKL